MKSELHTTPCDNPSYFSDVLAPAVTQRLPAKNSVAGRVLDYTTGIRPFFEAVSADLCDDGRMSTESANKAVRCITRSATSAAVIGGTASVAGLSLAVGSPVLTVGAGLVALAVLPPLIERAAFGVIHFASTLLDGVRRRRQGKFE